MTTIHPSSSGPLFRPMDARASHKPLPRRERLSAVRAYAAPPAVAGTMLPTTLAALSAPAVQVNAAAMLPHVEAFLAGPFGAPALALGCAISAGVAATARNGETNDKKRIHQFLRVAGQAGIGAPLMFGALQAAMGPAYTINMVARGVVFGVAALLGNFAGRQAGRITSNQVPPGWPSRGKTYTRAQALRHKHEHTEAARHGTRMGGLAAAAILGVAALRA